MPIKANSSWESLVGHSVLVRNNPEKQSVRFVGRFEYAVVAVSPSGLRVRFSTLKGSVFWVDADDFILIEDLGVKK